MKANETSFQPIMEGTKQYVIPLFQRAYSWEKKEWDVLWEDLVYLCEHGQPKTHFIGSVVTMPLDPAPEGVARFLLIDGQQRLTTLFVLLAVLRDAAAANGQTDLANEINQTMLVNPFKKGLDHFKLLPTQTDRAAFQGVIVRDSPDPQNLVVRCYAYFERKLRQGTVTIAALKDAVVGRLSVVSIKLDGDDNPHLVFESLNWKGRPLTQADLIRNYFFMRILAADQEEMHAKHWVPMQQRLGDNLTEFIRHYLMRSGVVVKQSDVYFTLKERTEKGDALAALQDLAMFAGYYHKLVAPEQEPNVSIRVALMRLNQLEVTTAYPFLLDCYHDYVRGKLTADELLAILRTIENYIVRRFVCNVPTNQLNKIFPLLYSQAQLQAAPDFVTGVRRVLQARGYPKDAEFRQRLTEAKLYGAGDRLRKTKLLLESLELAYGHKEQVPFDGLQIEHVMPQTLTPWWQQHLGDDWEADHEILLHTLGNLTLTGYNSELSNKPFYDSELSNEPFPDKKKRFTQSHLDLNLYFKSLTRWDREAIEIRAAALATTALGIWPCFGDTAPSLPTTPEMVTGKVVRALTIMGQNMVVTSWRDVLVETLDVIADLEPESFEKLAGEYPGFISADPGRFSAARKLKNGYVVGVNYSAKTIYRFCTQAVEFIGLTAEDWLVETE